MLGYQPYTVFWPSISQLLTPLEPSLNTDLIDG